MKLNPHLAINDTGFAFDPLTGHSYTLNPMALEIIMEIKQGHTEEEIAQSLAENFDAEPTVIKKDLLDFLELLRHYELLDHE
ncbi:MAG: HPr-rel-A system PqqD family peptide chaperone [Bacteroidales bacterium]